MRITGRLIAGADGVNSVVRRFAELPDPPANHLCTGVRAYFEGVEGLHKDNFIELVFSRELLPYYFWIFPEVDGRCNAGLAVLRSDISKKKVNAGALFEWHLRNHPAIAPRFANARMTGPPGAYSLPLGIRPGTLSGDRFLLLGDAASLVDPFTGEGIGNAMASGEVAARVARKCFGTGDLTPGALYEYDKQLKRRIGTELLASTVIQRLARNPWLFDLVTIKPVFYCLASLRIVRVPR
jgi:flavin-dependent dehydrogenase